MSNPAFMSVCFEGEKRELRSLYGKMKRLQEREKHKALLLSYTPQYKKEKMIEWKNENIAAAVINRKYKKC